MLKHFFEANDEMLDLYTDAITKAHGKNHPEVFEVRKLYETIQHKIQGNNMDLSNEFSELRGLQKILRFQMMFVRHLLKPISS